MRDSQRKSVSGTCRGVVSRPHVGIRLQPGAPCNGTPTDHGPRSDKWSIKGVLANGLASVVDWLRTERRQ